MPILLGQRIKNILLSFASPEIHPSLIFLYSFYHVFRLQAMWNHRWWKGDQNGKREVVGFLGLDCRGASRHIYLVHTSHFVYIFLQFLIPNSMKILSKLKTLTKMLVFQVSFRTVLEHAESSQSSSQGTRGGGTDTLAQSPTGLPGKSAPSDFLLAVFKSVSVSVINAKSKTLVRLSMRPWTCDFIECH